MPFFKIAAICSWCRACNIIRSAAVKLPQTPSTATRNGFNIILQAFSLDGKIGVREIKREGSG